MHDHSVPSNTIQYSERETERQEEHNISSFMADVRLYKPTVRQRYYKANIWSYMTCVRFRIGFYTVLHALLTLVCD